MWKRKKNCSRYFYQLSFLFLMVFASVANAAININARLVDGAPPQIDGVNSPSEWPATPQLQLQTPPYPIQTNVYMVYDNTYLYVLVDALGDMTESKGDNIGADECLMVFDLPPVHKIVEVWEDSGGLHGNPSNVAGTVAAMGYSGHRVYEFRIPLQGLGIQPGQSIPFYSPAMLKTPGFFASMPYDGDLVAGVHRDNVFPDGLTTSGFPLDSVSGHAILLLGASQGVLVPLLGTGGITALIAMLIAVGMWRLRSAKKQQN